MTGHIVDPWNGELVTLLRSPSLVNSLVWTSNQQWTPSGTWFAYWPHHNYASAAPLVLASYSTKVHRKYKLRSNNKKAPHGPHSWRHNSTHNLKIKKNAGRERKMKKPSPARGKKHVFNYRFPGIFHMLVERGWPGSGPRSSILALVVWREWNERSLDARSVV